MTGSITGVIINWCLNKLHENSNNTTRSHDIWREGITKTDCLPSTSKIVILYRWTEQNWNTCLPADVNFSACNTPYYRLKLFILYHSSSLSFPAAAAAPPPLAPLSPKEDKPSPLRKLRWWCMIPWQTSCSAHRSGWLTHCLGYDDNLWSLTSLTTVATQEEFYSFYFVKPPNLFS